MSPNDHENERLSLDEIARTLSPFVGHGVSKLQLISIAKYLELLKKWNQTISLTSITEDAEIVARHFGESMFVSSLHLMERGRLADVGSGAGFPGIPLKIAHPDLHVTLIEPNTKKCAFLREVQAALRLSGMQVIRSRYEDFDAPHNSFDFICSRALGASKGLLRWSKWVLRADGHVILWLGIEDSTLLASRAKGWNWERPVKIPESRRRAVLSGRPLG
ncbi:MAG: 16S rRNA (guanine(527)-N(7))-methyltransferase RsmG [Acidobacteria bacterium]|nr:MAG: 16S rRNA (guanine(527)-N(7))-methyltransferase RsmG [Acidobacteriota bacterium]PYU25343.1 MAG: 16S rRNA (guanine(527)-N(7))-methyltransferase RsmG [Acidobacteriota bacterium]